MVVAVMSLLVLRDILHRVSGPYGKMAVLCNCSATPQPSENLRLPFPVSCYAFLVSYDTFNLGLWDYFAF